MAIFLLDTTTLTHLRNGHPQVIANRVAHCDPNAGHVVAVASINVEEVVGGWLAYLQNARTEQQQTHGAERLNDSIQMLSCFTLISVTAAAITRHSALRKQKLNVGRNDLRLAALALELGATVVTDNVRDFIRVPGVLWVDWTR
jgi:tRNA(fMet)-specific endonuclease VapC